MVKAVTRNISVSVETSFLENDSDPEQQYFVWAYRITIENTGKETVQLLNRYWQITDAQGRGQEVRGAGVVGEIERRAARKFFRCRRRARSRVNGK